jgi:hypothetical protein
MSHGTIAGMHIQSEGWSGGCDGFTCTFADKAVCVNGAQYFRIRLLPLYLIRIRRQPTLRSLVPSGTYINLYCIRVVDVLIHIYKID